jgi:hypothetical protein
MMGTEQAGGHVPTIHDNDIGRESRRRPAGDLAESREADTYRVRKPRNTHTALKQSLPQVDRAEQMANPGAMPAVCVEEGVDDAARHRPM